MFNISLNIIIRQLMPPKKRTDSILALFNSAIKPLVELYDTFLDTRNNNLDYIAYSGQVIYLEKILNKKFNNDLPGIYISDAITFDYLWLYNTPENIPQYIFNQGELSFAIYVYNASDFQSNWDFIIYVPSAITFDENEMRSLVNRYKQAGKRYTIITY